jgi:hypothetical protein
LSAPACFRRRRQPPPSGSLRLGEQNGRRNFEVPAELDQEIDGLRVHLGKPKKNIFAIDHDGIRLRAVRFETVGGEIWAAMRRIPGAPPDLSRLGFRPEVLRRCGPPAAGRASRDVRSRGLRTI